MSKREQILLLLSWVIFIPLVPICFLGLFLFRLGFLLSDGVKALDNIDPMPWNQAILLGVALFSLICIAVFGNYVDGVAGV